MSAERIEFHSRPLQCGDDAERVIRGFADHRGPVIDVVCRDHEREWGRVTFRRDDAELLRDAIALARSGGKTGSIELGRLNGREITIALIARPRQGLLVLERARDGMPVGRPITLNEDEVTALAAALAWLTEEQHA